ncbi:MAG: hypothetical protein KKD28_14970 [Chloroflexi bacterium]|nr:hypothetical protein [Chloroflexota bacterium]MBU1662763.1 hypothetical protein [Chloroflexota bacterium]
MERIRERYLRDPLPIRLGGIAANLARICSCSEHDGLRDVVESILNESKYFIEWMAPESDFEIQVEVVELQIQLALWQNIFDCIWSEPTSRQAFATQAGWWSHRLLEKSGLLDER